MHLLENIEQVQSFFASLEGSFVGVGMSAYPRITPALVLDGYTIMTLRKTQDLPLLRNIADIFCLEEAMEETTGSFNSARLLGHGQANAFLKGLADPVRLMVYQNYPELETLTGLEGWRLLANPFFLRLKISQRSYFKKILLKLQIQDVPGGLFPLEFFLSRGYSFWEKAMGSSFVVQLHEVGQGGGKGTFFVKGPVHYEQLRERLGNGVWRGENIRWVFLRKYIEGCAASMALCLTRHGILRSSLQRQMIDLPYCRSFEENGVFCGHSWGESTWPGTIKAQAFDYAGRIGALLNDLGYKGICGIDFIIEDETDRVYPQEINPRLTAAFPVLSQLHLSKGIIPLEMFHILEFLDIPYEINVEALNARYEEPLRGGHLFLFHGGGGKRIDHEGLVPGLYEEHRASGEIRFVGEAFHMGQIEHGKQFILTEGPPDPRTLSGQTDPLGRNGRLLFPSPLVDHDGHISQETQRIIDWVYERLPGEPA
jgi:hypothetical protein